MYRTTRRGETNEPATSAVSNPSGGVVSNVITGKGLLSPGTYTGRCSLIIETGVHTVLTFTLPTGDYHTEVVDSVPSWLFQGMDLAFVIDLSDGVIAIRQGRKYALADAHTREQLTDYTDNIGTLIDRRRELKLAWAKPTLKEIRFGQQVYPFVKARPSPSQPHCHNPADNR